MTQITQPTYRPRRSWLMEALIVVGVLALGGFSLMTDGHVPLNELLGTLTSVVR